MVVDGSFVTGKPEPNDIDLIIVLGKDPGAAADASGMLLPAVYNIISQRRLRARYPFDGFISVDGTSQYDRELEFFAQVKAQPGAEKGLLRVDL